MLPVRVPTALAFSPSGDYLYVANRGSGNLSAYAVNTQLGRTDATADAYLSNRPGPIRCSGDRTIRLRSQQRRYQRHFCICNRRRNRRVNDRGGLPFAVGSNPHALAYLGLGFHYGRVFGSLYTANFDGSTSSISWMEADPQTGQLTETPASPFFRSARNYIAAGSATLFVATGLGVSEYITLAGFNLNASVPAASGANVYSVTVDPFSPFIYACNDGTDNVSGYSVRLESLIPIPGSPFAAGHHPYFIAVL